jgi:multidrug resistance efflux pump
MASGIVEPSQPGSQQQQQQQGKQQAARTPLVQRLLAGASSLPNFMQDLIRTQAHLVAGTEAAAFLLEPAPDQPNTFALRPIAHIREDESDEQTRAAALEAFAKIIQPCLQQQKDGVIQIEGSFDGSEHQYCLVTQLRSENNLVAASAVVTRCRDAERAQQRLELMKIVSGYFDMYSIRRRSEQDRSVAQSHQHVLMLATSVATAEGFESAAMNLCNELAARTGAVRVSLGWVKGDNIKLKAISHSEQFDKKQELSVQIVRVMEEALDNDEIVQYDPDGTTSETVTREAQALSTSQGGHTVLSLPLRRAGDVVGVMTLEFAANQRIGPQAAQGLAVAADLLAPQLYDRYQNDRWLITKVGLSIRHASGSLVGPKHMLAKVVCLLVLGLVLVTMNWVPFVDLRPVYHVKSGFQFVAAEETAFDSPLEGGVLYKVHVKPGELVEEGQVLFEFDVRDLKIQRDQYQAEAREADMRSFSLQGEGKTAESQLAEQQRIAAQKKADLYALQMERAVVKAPYAGQILSGDLSDRVGATFKKGDPMMKMARHGELKAKLFVAERDIQDVEVGKTGYLAVTRAPSDKFPFTIERIVPEGVIRDSGNVFEVYATMQKASDDWYPGMEGDAKVEVEKRPLAWIWVHRFIEWAEIKSWQYLDLW